MKIDQQPRLLISACLCGQRCRYDGGGFDQPALRRLINSGAALPFCPECAGGLPIPRTPCELSGEQVLARDGRDCTTEYHRGAALALELCRRYGLTAAILKDGSPSCGVTRIYDGTHTGRRIPGQGVTARLLAQEGIALYTEENWAERLSLSEIPPDKQP